MEWAEVVEIELRRGGPKSYCLLIPTIAPPMSDSSTNLSDIVQSRRRGDQVSVRGGRGAVDERVSDQNSVGDNLGYLEHLVCSRDDLFEAVDCISCGSRQRARQPSRRKGSLNFTWMSQTRRTVAFGSSRLTLADIM